MAKNDIILIDNIIKERMEAVFPSSDKGEVFEFLASEQILKDFDLTKEEISQGNVDGKDDGGIDSIFIFINGNLLSDIQDFQWPKRYCKITIYVITSKHHDTFKQEVVNNEYATISEFFDFAKNNDELLSRYNEDLLSKRELIIEAYSKVASSLDSLQFNFYYCSRGDSEFVGENIIARTEQIKNKLSTFFSNCSSDYFFLGSSEILSIFRQKPEFEMALPFVGIISQKEECSIVLCKLSDYYLFISDENKKLKKYLFDSNVRDYMGLNRVNEDIMETLRRKDSKTDFWWLNNGITILSTSAINVGNSLKIQNVQIVNGLQTSQTIHRHFSETEDVGDDRSVVLKIITQTNPIIRDAIIRSTNNQTSIELTSLFATDKIQRDIEDIMKQQGLYYERRANYYSNQDIDPQLIFDMLYLASGYVSLILKAPERGANFKQKNFKDPQKYNLIYNSKDSLLIWPKLAIILRKTDSVLSDIFRHRSGGVNMLKRARHLTSLITLSRIYNTYNFSAADIVSFDVNSYTKEKIVQSWELIEDWFSIEKIY